MWHTCLRLLAVAVVCLVFSCREAGSHVLDKRGNGRRYCGKNLSNILQVVCEGYYNSAFESHTKKSEVIDDIAIPPMGGNSEGYSGMWIDQLPEKEKEPIFPFRARPKASSLINGSFRRFTRGVYDECCVKGCTYNELASYCAIKRSQ